jgi:hypothetical protein
MGEWSGSAAYSSTDPFFEIDASRGVWALAASNNR